MSSFLWSYSNETANPSVGGANGTVVTPGASNAEGAWTQVASAANIAQDVCWVYLQVSSGSTTTAIKNHLIDLGADSAGGTSYTACVSNMVCGQSNAIGTATHGIEFMFPMCISAGSSVAVRIQGSNATAGTVRVGVKFYGQPSRPEASPIAQFSETIGTITGSAGVAFTPGNAVDRQADVVVAAWVSAR
jgi:hypothetical protein